MAMYPFDPTKQRNLDYSQLPKTGREAAENMSPSEYQQYLDGVNRTAEQTFYSGAVVRCSKDLHKPGKVVFACAHCVTQDEVHPVGIIASPFKYYLCKTCYDRHMLRRLDLGLKLQVHCHQCIIDEWNRIKRIDPTKVRDFAQG